MASCSHKWRLEGKQLLTTPHGGLPLQSVRKNLMGFNDEKLVAMIDRKKSTTERWRVAQIELIGAANGLIDSTEMAHRLGVAPETLNEMVKNGEILSVDFDQKAKFPVRQLTKDGDTLTGFTSVLQKLRSIGIDGWMALDILCSSTPKFGLSPFELLERNRSTDALEDATAYENQGCP